MLIVNADDWGRSTAETDAALKCFQRQRITSVSAMVFMQDSERAARLANANQVDVGLHLNFAEEFGGDSLSAELKETQKELVRFLMGSRYAQLIYNPFLRVRFATSCHAQFDEFRRLYQREPSHVDGHHHMHLCANVVASSMIPAGMKMRRNFSFWPGEKSKLNRLYRALVDRWLGRKYRLTDYFFDLTQSIREQKLPRVTDLAKSTVVELMTHPGSVFEFDYLMGDQFVSMTRNIRTGGYELF